MRPQGDIQTISARDVHLVFIKRMLSEFVQQHSATPSSKPPIYIVYLITGVSRDMNNEKVMQSATVCCTLFIHIVNVIFHVVQSIQL